MAAPDVKYGGDFTWVETVYTLKVPAGLSPLQWLNGLTKKFFGFQEIIFDCSGCFRKPGMQQPCFPVGKIDLRWRWDEACGRIAIDFFREDRLLPWRWDELRPTANFRFPNTAPDLIGIGHVGERTFHYAMLSHSSSNEEQAEPIVPFECSAEVDTHLKALAAVTAAENGLATVEAEFERDLDFSAEVC
eukprot:CAMPEP_0172763798 /NCGR_PEP_ID=MMETSP1074-20121228/176077_1 /TAXON_ID=2916 /ORGANISM="Ceratium fusus, Strain PA161109" /LENGTH=188 /DNA_ID=CAMNT_0013598455 /DNA_START=22 /DNA_END=588 /DNA_ORIENTATION=-